MRVWIVFGLFFLLVLTAPGARADSPVVVLRAMSAVPSAGSEWIALENTSGASISGQIWSIRDVQGSVKTWVLPGLGPYELKMFSGTETKISLNNTGDQVELLQGNMVVQSSAPYEELTSGSIWVLLGEAWFEMTQEDWDERWPVRDWTVASPSPSPTPQMSVAPTLVSSPKVTPSPKPTTTVVPVISSPSPIVSQEPVSETVKASWWESVALPHNEAIATSSGGQPSLPPIWEREPGDYTEESEIFRAWKRKIWLRLSVVFSCAVFSVSLCAPRLYRCYNDVCLLDDG